MTYSIDADSGRAAIFTIPEQECLRCIASHMMPASAEFGVPGADDASIFADMLGSIKRDTGSLKQLLKAVDEAAGDHLCDLPLHEQGVLLSRLRTQNPAGFAVVEGVVARAYYRDDRVMRSIGMEPRPPYPKGYELADTDWSLLEPVRARGFIGRLVD